MIIDSNYPQELQFKPDKIELDAQVEQAKAALLNDIKRSVYIYRCDLGGCNGCEIEIFATITPVFDAERFGIKNTPNPMYADILVYTGAVTRAMRMPGLRAYQTAPDPKLVVSYGACGCSGGIFHDTYCTWGGTDALLPVDVYIPGCPPSPAQTIFGFAMALGKLGQKLKRKDEAQGAGAPVSLAYADIPYKVRISIEREARLYSGYLYGRDLSDEFLGALEKDANVFANIHDLIATSDDPRKTEVFAHLRDQLAGMIQKPELAGLTPVVGPAAANSAATEPPLYISNVPDKELYGQIAAGSVHADSESKLAEFAAEHAAELADPEPAGK